MILLLSLAHAERPTEGGLFSFSENDDVYVYEVDEVRVHYSMSGTNVVRQTDDDSTGVPDFVEMVANEANQVLEAYALLGFRPPIRESEMGLDALGGSDALDVYLVDFGGSADGMFGIDTCVGIQCSGYMVMENDFWGYGYPSIEEAIRVLTSHELFHAVQAAYNAEQPVWLSEGMAVWAEWAYDAQAQDFYAFSQAYLEEANRSIHRPPAGMTTAFSYGTALFFAFLEEYVGGNPMPSIQETLSDRPDDEAIALVLEQLDSVEEGWLTFAQWNLATGSRSGAADSYSFASRLEGVVAESQGTTIQENHRFYPLAATYFLLQHRGGNAHFVYEGTEEDVVFSVHPVNEQGQVTTSSDSWKIGDSPIRTLELSAGEYWLLGTLPKLLSNSQELEFCFGQECELPSIEADEKEEASGCSSTPLASLWLTAAALGALRRRET